MRITCNTVEEFIENLELDKCHIVNDEVWIRVDEHHASEKNDVDWNVILWLTCVIDRPKCPYVLEFGKVVGMHIEAGDDKTTEGLEAAKQYIEDVKAKCEQLVMKTRNGKVEFV